MKKLISFFVFIAITLSVAYAEQPIVIQRGRYLGDVDIPEGSYILRIPEEVDSVSVQLYNKEEIPVIYSFLSNDNEETKAIKIYIKSSESLYVGGNVLIEKASPIFN